MKFIAKSKSFHELVFDATIINEIEFIDWWKSQIIGNNVKSVQEGFNSYFVHKLLDL